MGDRMPRPTGFTIDRSNAVWVVCEKCDEQNLIYGSDRNEQIKRWTADHRSDCTGGVPNGHT